MLAFFLGYQELVKLLYSIVILFIITEMFVADALYSSTCVVVIIRGPVGFLFSFSRFVACAERRPILRAALLN